MSPELEKVSQLQDLEIEGLELDGWLELSFEEMKARILESGKRELLADDFLILFQDADREQKDEITNTLEANDIRIIESSRDSTSYEPKTARKKTNKSTAKEEHELDPDDAIGMYLSEIGRVPLLTAEQEVLLSKRIEGGRKASEEMTKGAANPKKKALLRQVVEDGWAAREHLITANSRLVISVAKKYMGRGVPFLDLIQDGNIGLMRAAKKFDYRRGHKFSTYATWWIKQAVTRAIADHSRTIRIPVHAHETINKISKTTRHLEQKLGRTPTTEEIAEALDIPVEKVENLLKAGRQPLSLETPQDDDDDSPLEDFVGDESSPTPLEIADDNLLREQLRSVLHTLPPREVRVLQLRYGLHDGISYTLEKIGRMMGVTRERIRQIEAEALRHLRHPSRRRMLVDYLKE